MSNAYVAANLGRRKAYVLCRPARAFLGLVQRFTRRGWERGWGRGGGVGKGWGGWGGREGRGCEYRGGGVRSTLCDPANFSLRMHRDPGQVGGFFYETLNVA